MHKTVRRLKGVANSMMTNVKALELFQVNCLMMTLMKMHVGLVANVVSSWLVKKVIFDLNIIRNVFISVA